MRNAYKVLVGNSEGKRPLGRTRRRWEDSIKMDLRKICLESVDWMYVAKDTDSWHALMNTVMNVWFHKKQEIS
jgi:hypothetical protein